MDTPRTPRYKNGGGGRDELGSGGAEIRRFKRFLFLVAVSLELFNVANRTIGAVHPISVGSLTVPCLFLHIHARGWTLLVSRILCSPRKETSGGIINSCLA